MIQRQRHKRRRRPPDGDDLACDLTAADGDEDREADEPIRADGSKEDLMPHGVLGFLDGDGDGGLGVGGGFFEDAGVAC